MLWGPRGGKRGDRAEADPCVGRSDPREALGLVLLPRPRVRCRAAQAGPVRPSRARPAMPQSEAGPAARPNRCPGRAHTHPAPPGEPSASSTAAGWPSTAAEKKTASGSSCRPSQMLPSVRPRPSPAAARGSPPASPAAARLPGAGRPPGWTRPPGAELAAGEGWGRGGEGSRGGTRGGGDGCSRGAAGARPGPGAGARGMSEPGKRAAPGSSTGAGCSPSSFAQEVPRYSSAALINGKKPKECAFGFVPKSQGGNGSSKRLKAICPEPTELLNGSDPSSWAPALSCLTTASEWSHVMFVFVYLFKSGRYCYFPHTTGHDHLGFGGEPILCLGIFTYMPLNLTAPLGVGGIFPFSR